MAALEQAVKDLKENSIDALVTAPINKHAMQLADFGHVGHTEYLTQQFDVQESVMMMVSDQIKVALVTNHIPISDVAKHISTEKIIQKVEM
ncbi:unnamed protein product, partial [Cyprideis torosa]